MAHGGETWATQERYENDKAAELKLLLRNQNLKKNIGRPSTYSRAVHAVGLSGERRPWQPLQRPGTDGGPAPHTSRDPAACGVTSSRPPGTQAPVLGVAVGPTDPLGSETQRHARLERREPGPGAGPRGPSFQSLCFPCSRR